MKRLIAWIMLICMMLTGCQLAIEETGGEGMLSRDRLAGVVVTTEHLDLFDMEAYLEDNLNDVLKGQEADTSAYQGRIYAQERVEESTTEDGVPCTTTYYNFDFMDGIQLLCYEVQILLEDGTVHSQFATCSTSEGIFDARLGGVLNEGTIYVPKGSGEVCFFMNPVYQDSEGRLYLVSGTGISTNELMGSMSKTITEERTETIDGEVTTVKREFKITAEGVDVPDKVAVVQMSGDNAVLDRQEYTLENLPDTFTPVEGCTYILVEEYAGDEMKRTIIEPDTKHITIFVRSDKIYCTAAGTEILWPEE